ncbi:MAG: nucleotidyltransferase domain-containing protein, partial [Armatimonadota bacterium]
PLTHRLRGDARSQLPRDAPIPWPCFDDVPAKVYNPGVNASQWRMLTLSDVESRPPALRRVFSRAGVVAAYLHGSLAEGCPGPGSDVDFAVLLPRRLSRARMDALCARLTVDIGRVLDCANVGVQALNPTGYYFQYRVTTTGICIYARDPDEAADYQAWAAKRWCDFQWYQNIFDEAVRESIEGGDFGR